jgi:hypothetical protein
MILEEQLRFYKEKAKFLEEKVKFLEEKYNHNSSESEEEEIDVSKIDVEFTKKPKDSRYKKCPDCDTDIQTRSNKCQKCAALSRKKSKNKPETKQDSKQDSKPNRIRVVGTGRCNECGIPIERRAVKCRDCHCISTRKIKDRPSLEQLENDLEELPMTKIGEKYGVSDNAVRRWIKQYKAENLKSKSL